MKITFITLFPKIIENYISHSIFARAIKQKKIHIKIVDIRDFAQNKYKTCDDTPYGGGSGMVLSPEPLDRAIVSVKTKVSHVIFPTPVAPLFTQRDAVSLCNKKELLFICGRYEAIDERIIDLHVDKVYSIGEYVISSGELSSLVIVDAIYRLLDGIITYSSLQEESYNNNLLEYPHYTRPADFNGHKVPEVLLSGNHSKIKQWRNEQQIKKTQKYRPDLL